MMKTESAHGANGIPPIKETIGTPRWRARRATTRYLGQTFGSAMAMTAASVMAVIAASQLRAGSPWLGLNAVAGAAGLARSRPRRRFERNATLLGGAVLAGGLLVLAGLYQGARRAIGQRRAASGLAPAG